MPTYCFTTALEMPAFLLELGRGDEVIMPSYTFVSTANAIAPPSMKCWAASAPAEPIREGVQSTEHANMDAEQADDRRPDQRLGRVETTCREQCQ